MPVTKIQTIIDKQGNTILPRTRIEAVYLEDGETTIQDRLTEIETQVDSAASNAFAVAMAIALS